MADEPKKIIIDEDWKVQAQKEKEKLKEQEAAEEKTPREESGIGLPPADFSGLVSILASQAFYALGIFRMDEKDEREPDLPMAKFNIDMLGVLDEKCKGNLSAEESKMLKGTLDQLRMAFVQISK
ncbi:MAG: DUF1844 domain-containing protein [Planctomycetales bacterium]|nr:DUF1844 domain-containing protein [Planctomycetales bacterium]